MPVEVTIVADTEKLARLSAVLKRVGDQQLRRELYRGIQRATVPMKAAARASALQRLPKRGGLAGKVASSKLSTRTRGGRNPSVRIVASGGVDLRSMDRGRLRHPVFGNRRVWVNQSVAARWFTDPMRATAPAARTEIAGVLDRVAVDIAKVLHG